MKKVVVPTLPAQAEKPTSLLSHLVSVIFLLGIAFGYFAPAAFEGKNLQQSDNIQAMGMQAEMRAVEKETGDYPLWTNSMFAGMPTYQILYATSSVLKYPFKALLLGNDMRPPHTALFLMMLGMYVLLASLGMDWKIALFGAASFGFAGNTMDLFLAGHSTKIIALAYFPAVLAGAIQALKGRWLAGSALAGLALGLQIHANHIQITYYTLIVLGVVGLAMLTDAIQRKSLRGFALGAGAMVIVTLLAFGANAGRLMTTQEFAEETIRGKSELTQKAGSSGSTAGEGGLSKDYAFGWSYGVMESFSFLVPRFMGGSSNDNFIQDPESKSLAALRRMDNQEQAQQMAQQMQHYWGNQPFSGGPIYLGAVALFLFFLGAFLVKGPLRPAIISLVILTIVMSWGKNFAGFNYFLFDNLPYYNKFRAVTMILSITAPLVLILGFSGLQAFFSEKVESAKKKTALYLSGGIVGGLALLALLISGTLGYGVDAEAGFPPAVAEALQSDRAGLLRADALRALVFIGLAFGILFLALRQTLKPSLVMWGVGVLCLLDLVGIGGRYFGWDDFVSDTQKRQITQAKPVDEQIKRDPDIHYRVADFRGNPFSSAIASYHHKSMGGYNAAKLMRYQELIERYLGNPNEALHLYGMLNAKYFIVSDEQAQPNPLALGNAWFVDTLTLVANGDAEMDALADLDPETEVVVQESFKDYFNGLTLQGDSLASIELVSYHPDTLVYRYSAATEQLAVFSEVYYPPAKGWKVYIDGQPADPFVKANFLLRAMRVPAGQNREIRMVFSPDTYFKGEKIALFASLALLLLVLFVLFTQVTWKELVKLPARQAASTPKPAAGPAPKKKK